VNRIGNPAFRTPRCLLILGAIAAQGLAGGPALADSMPRVDLLPGFSVAYETTESEATDPNILRGAIGIDYRRDRWACGIALRTTQNRDLYSGGFTAATYFDPDVTAAVRLFDSPWLSLGLGGVLESYPDYVSVRHWRSAAAVCASLHQETHWGGMQERWFWDQGLGFAASAQGGGVVLGAGTSFGLGVDLDGKVEVMVAPKYGSESQLDSVVTSVRVAL